MSVRRKSYDRNMLYVILPRDTKGEVRGDSEITEAMKGRAKMEGARPTKLIYVSFYFGVHDLKWDGRGIPIATEITDYKE